MGRGTFIRNRNGNVRVGSGDLLGLAAREAILRFSKPDQRPEFAATGSLLFGSSKVRTSLMYVCHALSHRESAATFPLTSAALGTRDSLPDELEVSFACQCSHLSA